MSVNNTESVRNWFRACPAILQTKRFGVDWVSEQPTEYAVLSVPSSIRYRENILGAEVPEDIQSQNFVFTAKLPYGSDSIQNLENLAFYQDVVNWVIEKNDAREFPEWDGGTVKSVVPTLTTALMQGGSDTARYQIQIRITYRRN